MLSRSPRSKSNTGFVALIISLICVVGCVGIFLVAIFSDGSILSTPTPILASSSNLSTIIASTASAAQTQTMLAASPTPAILNTPTMLPPVTFAPSITSIAVDPSSQICQCNGGLGCKDFSTHDQAQACYEYCKALGHGDVHGLDGSDQDGLACENLP